KYLKNDKGEYVDANGNLVEKKEDAKNPQHGATVIGDTVGDPFKDTSGPSLNILIKLISMVSVATLGITMLCNNGKGVFDYIFSPSAEVPAKTAGVEPGNDKTAQVDPAK